MPDIRTGVVTSVGKMAKTITVTTRTMNPVPKLLVVSPTQPGRTKLTNQSVPHTNKYLVHDELDRTSFSSTSTSRSS
jgi:ribosomal protein S17